MACGPYNTWVVAKKEDKTKLVCDDAEGKEILKELRKILDEDGTLIQHFQLHYPLHRRKQEFLPA